MLRKRASPASRWGPTAGRGKSACPRKHAVCPGADTLAFGRRCIVVRLEGRIRAIAAGATYKANDQWKARFGIAFDQTPVRPIHGAAPDSTALAGSARTPPSFNQNQRSTAANALVNGSYDASVWMLALQGTYTF